MEYRVRIGQNDLRYLYESAKARMEAHPELADKHKNTIQQHPFFKTEKEALEAALTLRREKDDSNCQIWAKVIKDGDVYRIQDWWVVTDDWKIKQSAEYIGMTLMYDNTRLQNILDDNIQIDNVIAYYKNK